MAVSAQAILLPVFIQIGLTFGLSFWMAKARRDAFQRRDIHWRDIALKERPWPAEAQKIGNAFQNQFEIPVLFYVLCGFVLITKTQDLAFVVMEWAFVASRLAHAFVFTTSNHVPTRGLVYIAGVLVLFPMWIVFALKILFATP
jgi:hypothetical protein